MSDKSSDPEMPEWRGPALPPAVVEPPRGFRLSIVWIIPLIAALIGAWLAWKAISERGPTITIVFQSGEGLEPGKTAVKYRDVEVGKVVDVTLSEDRKNVIVTAELRNGTENWLVEGTRFWVVRPRVVAGSVSGLGTLLSGAYIGMDVAEGEKKLRSFHGLDVPPILTSDQMGRRYILKGEDLGSLDVGSPIFYRRIAVGQVLGYQMDPDGTGVTLQVFVEAPYDRFVVPATRFWHASGVDVSVSATGIRVDTESVLSILIGGLAFGAPPGSLETEGSEENSIFGLFANRESAMAPPKPPRRPFVLHFNESLRGLAVGAPVDFLGLPAGEVTGIQTEWNTQANQFRIAVEVDLAWGGIERDTNGKEIDQSTFAMRQRIQHLIDQGVRAQLRTGNLISGQLYVALDFFKDPRRYAIDWSQERPEFPTIPGALQSWSETAERIVKKIDALPLNELVGELRQSVRSLDQTLKSAERLTTNLDKELAPEIKAALVNAARTLAEAQRVLSSESPLQSEARDALGQVGRAAQSVRLLTDYLERHPESLVFGKEKKK